MEGDIHGNGLEQLYGINITLCAELCTARRDCKSFEHSTDQCNLNGEKVPNGPKWKDFDFCSKYGKIISEDFSLLHQKLYFSLLYF